MTNMFVKYNGFNQEIGQQLATPFSAWLDEYLTQGKATVEAEVRWYAAGEFPSKDIEKHSDERERLENLSSDLIHVIIVERSSDINRPADRYVGVCFLKSDDLEERLSIWDMKIDGTDNFPDAEQALLLGSFEQS
jgi:hypothetical protein